jgi:hypothetical protein
VFAIILLALPPLYLLEERLRGEWLLAACQRDLLARGEKLTLAELIPPPPTGTNVRVVTPPQAARLLDVGPPPLYGFPSPSVAPAPGTEPVYAQRDRWQAGDRAVYTWGGYPVKSARTRARLPELRRQLTNAVIHVRDMQDPGGRHFSSASVRHPVIALHQAALYALREGDLPGALQNLHACARLDELLAQGSFRAWQSLRSIGAEQTAKVIWQALQSAGWSAAQLARLQHDWEGKAFTSANVAALRAGRTAYLSAFPGGDVYDPDTFAPLFRPSRLGFPDPLDRIPGMRTLGEKLGKLQAAGRRACWEAIWSWHDQRRFLLGMQELLDLAEHAWHGQVLAPICDFARNPTNLVGKPLLLNNWRAAGSRGLRAVASAHCFMNLCPPTFFLRPALAGTWTRLAVTAIALKRHELRHGTFPQTLTSLVPEFLEAVPIDPMDGQPLRYRREEDGGFLLYSVGLDGIDQGGNPTVTGITPNIGPAPMDLVWPKPAPATVAAEPDSGARTGFP